MRYFFELIEGSKRVRDPEGGDYDGLASAKAEAEQVARDLAAEHLRKGRALPLAWRIEITDSFGQVCAIVAFDTAILERKPTVKTSAEQGPQPVVLGWLEECRRAHSLLIEAHTLMQTPRSS
jgi:hypothetical protein